MMSKIKGDCTIKVFFCRDGQGGEGASPHLQIICSPSHSCRCQLFLNDIVTISPLLRLTSATKNNLLLNCHNLYDVNLFSSRINHIHNINCQLAIPFLAFRCAFETIVIVHHSLPALK